MNQHHMPGMKMIISDALANPKPSTYASKTETVEELNQAIGASRDVLVRATTVFPFTLFPDTITLDRTQLTITKRDMFRAGEVLSIRVEDILNVTASVDLFFGSIKISTRFFDVDKPYTIRYFRRADALRIKRIVQGYLVAKQRGIDCSALQTTELATMLDNLGKVSPEDKV
jgi:hypothetical protein